MSEYRPISSWHIARTLMREGLIVPRPLSRVSLRRARPHRSRKSGIVRCHADDSRNSRGFQAPFDSAFEAISNFVAEASDAIWAQVYGESLVRQVCESIFGRNLRMEILRPRNIRRRILLSGGLGSGRPGVGDSIRRLMVDCLVRRMSFGQSAADSVSAKLSVGHDAIEGELFGGIRTSKGEQQLGLLSLCQDSVLFVDGVLSIPDGLQRRLLDIVDVIDAGHTPRLMALSASAHLVTGARPDELIGRDELPHRCNDRCSRPCAEMVSLSLHRLDRSSKTGPSGYASSL